MSDELFAYFMEQTNKRLDAQSAKLDAILKWKWSWIGASTLASAICSLLVTVYFGK